jgi:hypothetical protein
MPCVVKRAGCTDQRAKPFGARDDPHLVVIFAARGERFGAPLDRERLVAQSVQQLSVIRSALLRPKENFRDGGFLHGNFAVSSSTRKRH